MDWWPASFEETVKIVSGAALSFALGVLGVLGYKNKGQAVTKDVELAGAIVDNSAILKLANAIQDHTDMMEQQREQLERLIASFNRNSNELENLAREVRYSVSEFIRHSARGH